MTHDVCNKQRLYDEYVETMTEDMIAMVMENLIGRPPTQREVEDALDAEPRAILGPPPTSEQTSQRVARPIYVVLPRPYIAIDVFVEL